MKRLEERIINAFLKDANVTLVSREQTTEDLTLIDCLISNNLVSQLMKHVKAKEEGNQAEKDDLGLVFMFNQIDAVGLKSCARYMRYKAGRRTQPPEPPITSYNISEQTQDKWDGNFAQSMTPKVAFSVLHAAAILEIPGLLGLIEARIACWIKNRTVDEIKDIFSDQRMDEMPADPDIPFAEEL